MTRHWRRSRRRGGENTTDRRRRAEHGEQYAACQAARQACPVFSHRRSSNSVTPPVGLRRQSSRLPRQPASVVRPVSAIRKMRSGCAGCAPQTTAPSANTALETQRARQPCHDPRRSANQLAAVGAIARRQTRAASRRTRSHAHRRVTGGVLVRAYKQQRSPSMYARPRLLSDTGSHARAAVDGLTSQHGRRFRP
jgi:hypothetical protein